MVVILHHEPMYGERRLNPLGRHDRVEVEFARSKQQTTGMHADKKIRNEIAQRRKTFEQVQELTTRIRQRSRGSPWRGRPLSPVPPHDRICGAPGSRHRDAPRSGSTFKLALDWAGAGLCASARLS